MKNKIIEGLKRLFKRQPNIKFTVHDAPTIPFHIKQIAKMYPITITGDNRAVGEIKIIRFTYEHNLGVGQLFASQIVDDTIVEWWVYLGNDYFKQLYKK